MSNAKKFNIQVVKKIGVALGIDWKNFNFEQFRMGLEVELEHGNSKIIRKTNPILEKVLVLLYHKIHKTNSPSLDHI